MGNCILPRMCAVFHVPWLNPNRGPSCARRRGTESVPVTEPERELKPQWGLRAISCGFNLSSQVSQKLGNFQAVPTLNLRDDAAPKPEQLALECATTITRARDPQFK